MGHVVMNELNSLARLSKLLYLEKAEYVSDNIS